jgi:hypothetical protein
MMVSVIGQGRELFSLWYLATKAFASLSVRRAAPVFSGDLISCVRQFGELLNRVVNSKQRSLAISKA